MADETLTIDISVWQHKLAQLSVLTGKGMQEVIAEEWPLLVRKIIDFTPPKTLAQGRAAVSRDIAKTMRPFNPASIRTEGLREVVQKKDIAGFNLMASRVKSGPMAGARAVPFSGDRHTLSRNRLGRVPGKGVNDVVLGSDQKLLKTYVKSVQDRVGYAKAGWLRALHAVGATGPSFVERHAPGPGAVIDDRGNENNPSITAINRSPWAGRPDEPRRIVQDAYYSRATAIFSKVRVKLRLAIKGAGFDMAA